MKIYRTIHLSALKADHRSIYNHFADVRRDPEWQRGLWSIKSIKDYYRNVVIESTMNDEMDFKKAGKQMVDLMTLVKDLRSRGIERVAI